jgi:HEAT repeat protein
MSLPTTSPDPRDPAQLPPLTDLPPVETPSVGFIVQLFVIPAIIVVVVIAVWLLFGRLAGGERDAMEYVRLIRSPSTNSRSAFRAAFELASLIQNDAKLARDPRLLGELTDLLDHNLDHKENAQITQYVALALGEFQTLDATLASGRKTDPIAALSKALGPTQPADVRVAAAASLAKHAARLDGTLSDERAVKALDAASHDSDAELRQIAVYALGFFGGEPAAAILREKLNDEDRFVRYNAALALGRRGDLKALGLFREMLTPADLEKVITIESESEKRNKIEAIEIEALLALETSVRQGHPALAEPLRPEVERLTRSGLVGVRNNAQAVLKTLPASH